MGARALLMALLFQANLLLAQAPLPIIITPATAGPSLRSAPGTLPQAAIAPKKEEELLEHLISFDPSQLELRWSQTGWQLRCGDVLLKDFGRNEMAARQLQLTIRELRLNQYGSVGGTKPVLEYYLCDLQAPQGLATGLRLSSMDQASLRVEQTYGQWCVRDAYRILLNFENNEEAARQGLAILKKYHFTRVGTAGYGASAVQVFLTRPGDEYARGASLSTSGTLPQRAP